MPLYSFRDTATGEVYDIQLSIKDLDLYKEEHPGHERYFDAAGIPSLVSGVAVTGKTDGGFNEVLSKISEAHPTSELADRYGRKTIKQAKTDRAVRKWRSTTGGAT
jgi:predicted nucleic acid-binding Zn ribbon protein